MQANDPVPEWFEIETRENETFVILACVQGTYDVRWFLDANGVDERRIACAIAELGRSKRVKVRKHEARPQAAQW